MSKVRVVVAEIEGSDEAVLSAIRAVTERMGLGVGVGDGGVQPVAALPAAPVEHAAKRIAPARKKPDVQKERAAVAARIMERVTDTLSGQIRAAVADGPKTGEEVLKYVKAHGYPDANSSTVSTILCQRRKANEMYKDDSDLTWRMALR